MRQERTIDAALRIARERRQTRTDADFCRLLGVDPDGREFTQQRLRNWKIRGMPPSFERWVAERIGAHPDELHGEADTGQNSNQVTADTTEERQLLFYYRNMQAPARDALSLVAAALALTAPTLRQRNPIPRKKKEGR